MEAVSIRTVFTVKRLGQVTYGVVWIHIQGVLLIGSQILEIKTVYAIIPV